MAPFREPTPKGTALHPDNIGPQFSKRLFCEHCGESLDNHVSDEWGKHGAHAIFDEIAGKFNPSITPVKFDGELKYPDDHTPTLHPDLVASMGKIEQNRPVNLNDRADLVHHLESPHGHNFIDDVGYGSIEYRDAFDHIEDHVPGVNFDSGPEKLSLKELQALHDWHHEVNGIKHLNEGGMHYHV